MKKLNFEFIVYFNDNENIKKLNKFLQYNCQDVNLINKNKTNVCYLRCDNIRHLCHVFNEVANNNYSYEKISTIHQI